MNSREKYDQKLAILQRLEELGAEDWFKERLAKRLLRYFPFDSLDVLNTFARHNWTPSDLFHWLIHAPTFRQADKGWAVMYESIFLAEKVMVQAGLSPESAHYLALTQHWVFTIPPVTLEFSIKTLVNLGYGEDVIKSIANKMPQIFFLVPEHIVHECETATRGHYGLLWNPNLRSKGMQSRPPDDRDLLESVIASRKNHKKIVKPEADYLLPARADKSNDNQGIDPDLAQDGRPTLETASAAAPKLQKAWKPLKLFNPLKDGGVAVKDSKPDEPEIGEDDQEDNSSLNQWVLPPGSVAPAEPNEARLEEDDGSRLHIEKIKALINAIDDEPDAWNAFLNNNPWLKQSSAVEYKACAVLLRWIPLHSPGSAGSFRDDTDAGLHFRFWKKVLLNSKYRCILQITPDTLERRLYVLRRIGRCPMKGPSWIMKPWEILGDAELRFRINEIDANGKNPKLRPYINMLLEPKREDFKQRLANFLQSKTYHMPFYSEPDDGGLIYDSDDPPPKFMSSEELKERLLARRKKN